MTLTVRAVGLDDLPQLVQLMRGYIVDFYLQPDPGDDAIAGLIRELLAYPDRGAQFAAEDGGQGEARDGNRLVGFATLYYAYSTLRVRRTAILNDLFVVPERRGSGVGQRLFEHCLAHVRARGMAAMEWETAADNVVAQGLYRKMGGQVSDFIHYSIG